MSTLPAGFSADSQHMRRQTSASLLLGTGLAVHIFKNQSSKQAGKQASKQGWWLSVSFPPALRQLTPGTEALKRAVADKEAENKWICSRRAFAD